MLKHFALVALASLLAQGVLAAPTECPKGQFKSGGSCVNCPAGTYQSEDNYNGATCHTVSAGYEASDFRDPGNKEGAREESVCGAGWYSAGGTDTCHICPAGTECTKEDNREPTKCHYGHYQPQAGSPEPCAPCPEGHFNNVRGATSCCTCCRGFYQANTGKRGCEKCPASRPYSNPGATNNGENGENDEPEEEGNGCTAEPISPGPVASCDQAEADDPSESQCPATDPPSPSNIPRSLRKRCARGYKKCAVLHGRGGWDCVDVANDIESCGDCVNLNNPEKGGKDCTAIEGANNVQCVRGKCVVNSCSPGYELNSTGGCDPVLVTRSRRHHF